ncbi:STAS domain-containing protein [Blastococcus sp. KM273128]|uniref:STAS domain-containing protein n=1 Tax=Blastococcus sp. KM273128 TaxID=2570314 RepID=UPI001F220D9D|nr:STAS domain-containing protein [Blastococcus sp. KM273128]
MTLSNPPRPFGSILVKDEDGRPVLHLAGEIDTGAVAAFERSVEGAAPRVTAVDAEGVTFMNSSAISLLTRVTEDHRRGGGRPVLRRPARCVQLVLGVTGIDQLFDIQR